MCCGFDDTVENKRRVMADIGRGRQRDAFFIRDVFRCNRDADAYRCPADKLLNYCDTNRVSRFRVYRSHPADCNTCNLKPQCTIGKECGVTG